MAIPFITYLFPSNCALHILHIFTVDLDTYAYSLSYYTSDFTLFSFEFFMVKFKFTVDAATLTWQLIESMAVLFFFSLVLT